MKSNTNIVGMVITLAIAALMVIPAGLSANLDDAGNDYYLVEFSEMSPSLMPSITEMGGTVHQYYAKNTLLLELNSDMAASMDSMSFVKAINPIFPESKIDNNLIGRVGDVKLNIQLYNAEDLDAVSHEIINLGGQIENMYAESTNTIICSIGASQIDAISQMKPVLSIFEEGERQTHMNLITSDTYMGHDTAQAGGFTGSGILAEVQDNGIDRTLSDLSQVIYTDGGVSVKAHGTCTSGIVFGTGEGNAIAQGIAYEAVGAFSDWSTGRSLSVSNLWDGDFNQGSAGMNGVVQSNSWSQGNLDGLYTSYSTEDDQAVVDYPHVLTLWATGNGNDGTAEGQLSQDSIAKNVMSVGAVDHKNTAALTDDDWVNDGIGQTPSRGPAADGRQKPDMCGPFDWIYTTDAVQYCQDAVDSGYNPAGDGYEPGSEYWDSFGGTSGSTPVVAGSAILAYEMYRENHFDNNPGGDWPYSSTIKALLIADAYQYPLTGTFSATRNEQGWGTPDTEYMYDLGADNHAIFENPEALDSAQIWNNDIYSDGTNPLKITLAWIDPAASQFTGSGRALINNLDLKVTAPGGSVVYWGNNGLWDNLFSTSGTGANQWGSDYRDDLNNVENVFIETPTVGTWTIDVIGRSGDIGSGPQNFSVVASGAQIDSDIPDPITDLQINPASETETSIGLRWSAPYEDGTANSGTCSGYVVRYSTSPILDQADFDSATNFVNFWTPLTPGSTEIRTVTGLVEGTYYYFAVEAYDDVMNQAPMSNAPVMGRTLGAPVVSILTPNPVLGNQILSGSYEITWTATDTADSDPTLDITVEYSPNGGGSWVILESGTSNNDGTYDWNTASVSDGVNYLIRITATDSDAFSTTATSSKPFSIDNLLGDKWFFQVQTAGLYKDLDMKPVETSPNTIASPGLSSVGQHLVGRWDSNPINGQDLGDTATFSIYGRTSNPGTLEGYLFAKLFTSSDMITPIETSTLDNENIGNYPASHLFTWSDVLSGDIVEGDNLVVEIWVEVIVPSGGPLSASYVPTDTEVTATFYDTSAIDVNGPSTGLSGEAQYPFDATMDTQTSTSNDIRAVTVDPGFGDEIFTMSEVDITIDPATITQIDMTFEGQAAAATDFQIWAYNTASGWAQVGTPVSAAAATDITITRSITTDFANYINGTTLTWGCYQTDNSDPVEVDLIETTIYYDQPLPVFQMEYDYGITQSSIVPGLVMTGPTYDIDLAGYSAGDWVFVSYPVEVSGNIESVLDDSVLGNGGTTWDVAKYYDATDPTDPWKTYRIGVSTNDFTNIDNTMGVWLHLTANAGDTLTLSQTAGYSAVAVDIPLEAGWNLVGYPSASPLDADTSLTGTGADFISIYNGGAPYLIQDLAVVPGAHTFTPGNAYWVHVPAPTMWSVAP